MQNDTHDPRTLPDLPDDTPTKRPWHAPRLTKISVIGTNSGPSLFVVEDTNYYPFEVIS